MLISAYNITICNTKCSIIIINPTITASTVRTQNLSYARPEKRTVPRDIEWLLQSTKPTSKYPTYPIQTSAIHIYYTYAIPKLHPAVCNKEHITYLYVALIQNIHIPHNERYKRQRLCTVAKYVIPRICAYFTFPEFRWNGICFCT